MAYMLISSSLRLTHINVRHVERIIRQHECSGVAHTRIRMNTMSIAVLFHALQPCYRQQSLLYSLLFFRFDPVNEKVFVFFLLYAR